MTAPIAASETAGVPMYLVGYCPMGCHGQTLVVRRGHALCSAPSCPRPMAAAEILWDREQLHLVRLGEHGFTIQHPLWERLDDGLFACNVQTSIQSLGGAPVPPGLYRLHDEGTEVGDWKWEARP
jgi:hypothetical protein